MSKSISVEIEDFDMAREIKAHSPFSASGAERWEACPGSVKRSIGIPDKDSIWSIEGTRAHGVLERILKAAIQQDATRVDSVTGERPRAFPPEMLSHGMYAANFILGMYHERQANDLLVETKIQLNPARPDIFGTFDAAVVEHFGTLDVIDYKYGAGHAVSPVENMQMAFYGIALARKYDWNFKRVRHWIIQPRIKGYDGPVFWEVPTMELKTKWVDRFERAIDEVTDSPDKLVEDTGSGKSWCHWCKAKPVCPLKSDRKNEKAKSIFTPVTAKGVSHGKEESQESETEEGGEEVLRSEADWREEAKARKGKTKKGQVDKALLEVSIAYGRAEDPAGFTPSDDFF